MMIERQPSKSLFMVAEWWLMVALTLLLILSVITLGTGVVGWLSYLPAGFVSLPFICVVVGLCLVAKPYWNDRSPRWQLLSLGMIWLLHFVNVLVPETGFDAVWYHLPVIAHFVELGKINYIPLLYQSANPLAADLVFLLGFQLAGELGAKMVAFGFGLTLLLVLSLLAKQFLRASHWQLWFLLSCSLIQPVAWQVSSVYVDVAAAVWQLSAVFILVSYRKSPRHLLLAGAMVGMAVATKAFLWVIVPFFLVVVLLYRLNLVFFLAGFSLVVVPFYGYIFASVGNPFYSLALHSAKLAEIGGTSAWNDFLFTRILTLPYSLWYLTTQATDYVSLLLLVFAPLGVWQLLNQVQTKINSVLLIIGMFVILQWMLWWFVPPTSTRYALAGFCLLLLLLIRAAERTVTQQKAYWLAALQLVLVITTVWHLAPRVLVGARSMKYLSGMQTKEAYLQQFKDGNVDQHLSRWHSR